MMYYRRKILLALIEAFDGNLKSTDCEKLLFNFCKMTQKNYYDFFPYRFGPFSFVSYYDKTRLTELGLLKPTQDFELSKKHSYLKEINLSDRKALIELKAMGLVGKRLIQKTYRENPQFTVKSELLLKLFDANEIKQLQFAWNLDESPLIFTTGYEGESIDSFLYKLITNNIMAVADVRSNPQSMKYGFSKKSFSSFIEKAGLKYFHIPELGIPSTMRKGLGQTFTHKKLFEKYETSILPKQENAKDCLIDLISTYPRIALVCFEADHHFCHRYILIENLKKEKKLSKSVVHL
jgi:uncharacterized protein (DUF488 family)